MSTTTHPGRSLFVTLPIADVARSTAFFSALGFSFDPAMGDEHGACMLVGESACVMLVERGTWAELSKRPAADPTTHALGLFCFTVASREEVDAVVDAAVAEGAIDHDDADDQGVMYSRSFFDLDGHGWQAMWFDAAAAVPSAESAAGTSA